MEGYDSEREGSQNESTDMAHLQQPSHHDPALILSLPEEIIIHISLEACKPFYESESSVQALQPANPAFLGKICKQWRQIAMSTQELWKFILIAIEEPSDYGGLENEAQIEHFKTCIDRSGNYPLFVQLAGDGHDPDPHLLDNIYDLLKLCSHRIDHFSSLGLPSLVETLGALNLPILTSMAYKSYADWWWCLAKDAPLLRSISLSHLPLSTDDLKWEELNELRLIRCRWKTCLNDLCLARNLVHCHIRGLDPFHEFNDDGSMAQLPHLSTLIMSNPFAAMLTIVLDRIETPALKRLEVQWEEEVLEPLISITHLVARSSCSLDQLGITAHPITDSRLAMGCLDSIPNLSRLELYLNEDNANHVINHLNHTAQPLDIYMNRVLFPNLHQVIDEIPLISHYKVLFDEMDERPVGNFKLVQRRIFYINDLTLELYKGVERRPLRDLLN